MIRLGLGLIFACMAAHAAHASDALPPAQPAKAHVDMHCAALGEGFFAVTGSSACIKISGRISAGVGYASGSASTNNSGPRFGAPPADGFDAEMAASGDLRFNTSAGPARVYVGVRKDTGPRWMIDGQ
jgi:hypothetical protein